jgi:hypothetical protein
MIEICMCSYSRPERLPIIRQQLEAQTRKDFNFNVWDNTKDNQGSSARFKLAKAVKGNPIIFIDDDESLEPDFVEYMMIQYEPDAIKGWFTRIFNGESYWDSIPYSPAGTEVDYVGTGGMILDRKIFDDELILQELPPEFDKVEDLYLSYLARERGLKLIAVESHIKIEVDGKDQFRDLGFYKENAFQLLRQSGWKLKREF